jgi:hypothetical protein
MTYVRRKPFPQSLKPYKPATILYHGHNITDRTVTFSVDGVRYEYWFNKPGYYRVVEHLAHKVSLGKALAFAKKHASKVTREV